MGYFILFLKGLFNMYGVSSVGALSVRLVFLLSCFLVTGQAEGFGGFFGLINFKEEERWLVNTVDPARCGTNTRRISRKELVREPWFTVLSDNRT